MSEVPVPKVFILYKLIMTGAIFVMGIIMTMASSFSLIMGRTGFLKVEDSVLCAITGLICMCFAGFIWRQVRRGQA